MCRGSMAWVHVSCLDKWRHASENPKAFFRCEQCLFEYRLGRTFAAFPGDRLTLARALSGPYAVHLLSVLVLLAMVFVAGFIAKAFVAEMTWWEVFAFVNKGHWLVGSALVGGASLVGWLLSATSSPVVLNRGDAAAAGAREFVLAELPAALRPAATMATKVGAAAAAPAAAPTSCNLTDVWTGARRTVGATVAVSDLAAQSTEFFTLSDCH
eukprot:g6310.t1